MSEPKFRHMIICKECGEKMTPHDFEHHICPVAENEPKPFTDEQMKLIEIQLNQTGALKTWDSYYRRFLDTIAARDKQIVDMFEIGRGQEAEIIALQSRLERMEKLLKIAPDHHYKYCSVGNKGRCDCGIVDWHQKFCEALKEKP